MARNMWVKRMSADVYHPSVSAERMSLGNTHCSGGTMERLGGIISREVFYMEKHRPPVKPTHSNPFVTYAITQIFTRMSIILFCRVCHWEMHILNLYVKNMFWSVFVNRRWYFLKNDKWKYLLVPFLILGCKNKTRKFINFTNRNGK